jgi:ankyrin repeat protein
MSDRIFDTLRQSVASDDTAAVAGLLEQHRERFLESVAAGTCPPLTLFSAIRSVPMVDLLLSHGLDPGKISEWWAPGFGLNDVLPEVAEHFIQRGVIVTPHAASALGLTAILRALFEGDPQLIHAKGGDGCTPLHFSRNVETVRLLAAHGAALDARDDDHDSTPAQWRIGDAPEVTRFLLEQGARPDIFMAAALDDRELARSLITNDPACTTFRIGNNSGPFPGIGFEKRGGTIYQWTLGFNQSPQEIAFHRGHRELFDFLMERTPARPRLLIACMLANRPLAEEIVRQHPGLVAELNDEDKALLAKCCWETNLNPEAVRLMLDLGFPVDAPEFNHGFQPLHNAAWCGDPELVELLIARGHPVDRRDPCYHSTPLGFAIHSCVTARRHPEGDFPGVVQLLLNAGTPVAEGTFPTGDEGIDAAFQDYRRGSPPPE